MNKNRIHIGVLLLPLLLCACEGGRSEAEFRGSQMTVFEGPVPRAHCGPGGNPEPADVLQGEAAQDEAYSCNLELIGQHDGPASQSLAWFEHCAYYGQESTNLDAGSVVLDVAEPTQPKETARLTSFAMLDPHESMKVHQGRGLLAAVAGTDPVGNGPVFFDIYDVNKDCSQPELAASVPLQIPLGHEGLFNPDGTIYYGSSLYANTLVAIDVSQPKEPELITALPVGTHGLASNVDGTRLYLAAAFPSTPTVSTGNGLVIMDATEIEQRKPNPQLRKISEVVWDDGLAAQLPLPVTIQGRPYILFTDEVSAGAARFIDISDETKPFVVSKLKLEVNMVGIGNAHYCNVDRRIEPTIAACTYYDSGLRVFDIRNPAAPREIAYYNEPGTDPVSDVRFIPERAELWYTARPKGFRVVRFSNGVWPFKQ